MPTGRCVDCSIPTCGEHDFPLDRHLSLYAMAYTTGTAQVGIPCRPLAYIFYLELSDYSMLLIHVIQVVYWLDSSVYFSRGSDLYTLFPRYLYICVHSGTPGGHLRLEVIARSTWAPVRDTFIYFFFCIQRLYLHMYLYSRCIFVEAMYFVMYPDMYSGIRGLYYERVMYHVFI